MKSTLLKDTFREIGNTLGRFLAIFTIVALGVGLFAGIKATAPDMKITADKYFDDYDLFDIRLVSTMGFSEKDIDEIKKVSEIEKLDPSYSMDVLADDGEKTRVVKLLSIPNDIDNHDDYVNKINLVQGRLPEKEGECLAERDSMTMESLSIGSKVKLSSGTSKKIGDSLKRDEYTVVGLVESPLYISFERGTTTIGNGQIDSYIMIPKDDFAIPYFTDVYITIKGAKNAQTYDDEYDKILEPIVKKLEGVADIRKEDRYKEIVDEANGKLNKAKKDLEEGEKKQQTELKKAEDKLSDAKIKISKGENELAQKESDFNKTIKAAEDRLASEYNKLEQGEKEYYKNLNYFNDNKNKVNTQLKESEDKIKLAEDELNKSEDELNKLKLSLDYITDPEEKAKTLAAIDMYEKEIESGRGKILSSKAELEKGRQELIYGEQKLKQTKKAIDEGKLRIQNEEKKLKTAKEKAKGEFSLAHKKLNSSKEEYEKGYSEYKKSKEESNDELNKAREKIAKGEKDINEIEKPKWYIIKRNQTYDFIDYGMAADRIDAVAQVFPVFFFIIAVLVCLTTMTRMVDEQRSYIGSLKSMGYKNIAIASKYLLYSAIASICGSIVGLLVGFKVFPTVIFNAYRIMYIMPPVIAEFNSYYAIISTVSAVLATTMAAWIACYNELKETPANLLRPKAPKAGKRILLERIKFIWNKLKFSQKVTARNLFRYKKRFIMTIVGISGCTALLVAGFGLKDSITSITDKQFGEIYTYQIAVELKNGINKGQSTKVLDHIKGDTNINDYILIKDQVVNIGKGNIEKTANLIVPEKPERIKDFIILKNRITKQEIDIQEDGIVLTEKMAKLLKADVGDEVYIKVDEDKKEKVKITGITENYSFHYIYMSPNLYKKVFKDKVDFQKILAKTTNTDEDYISKQLLQYDDVGSVRFITGISKNFKDTIGSLNYVILVLIFCAGALAFVVLYNLTNINISERIREIATIKVLGFYDEEVSKYVYRENIILTIIGTVLGLVLGVFLHRFIILTAETEFIMFGRKIKVVSYIYSAILTILFSVFVNFIMYYKLKKIDMVESLKSVD